MKPSYQVAQSDCGVACAHMLLQAAGVQSSLRDMRVLYSPGRDGLTVRQITHILRDHGLASKVFRCSYSKLTTLRFPAIVAWIPNHYVVVTRVSNSHWRIIDPAVGRRRVSPREFRERFAGLCVVSDRVAEETRSETTGDESSWLVIGRLLRHKMTVFLPLLLGICMVGLITLYVPEGTSRIVDEYREQPSAALWASLAALAGGFFLVQGLNVVLTSFSATEIGRTLSERVYHSLLEAPITYFLVRPQGELLYRISLVKTLENFITSSLPKLLVAGVMVTISFICLLGADSMAFVLMCVTASLYLALFRYSRIKMNKISEELNAIESLANSVLVDSITSIQVVKSGGLESFTFEQWCTRNRRVFQLERKRTIVAGIVSAFVSALQSCLPIAVFLIAFWRSRQEAPLASALRAQLLSTIILTQLTTIVDAAGKLGETGAAVRRVDDMVTYRDQPIFRKGASKNFQMPMSAESVSFSYGAFSGRAVDQVSLKVDSHRRVAVVGHTGCGKSTLAQLLAGLLNPISGRVMVGGIDIRDVRQKDFYDNVVYIPQDAPLRSASLRDNLCWGEQISDEDLLDALAKAQFAFDSIEFPQGLDTFLVNGGRNISGGQRQRIAIARCFLCTPQVIILDEATSGLDQQTEALLYRVFQKLDCALVAITHRLETIRDFDEIIVMRDGAIVEAGSFNELLDIEGEFSLMHNAYRKTREAAS